MPLNIFINSLQWEQLPNYSKYTCKNWEKDVTLIWNANEEIKCKRGTLGTWIWLHLYFLMIWWGEDTGSQWQPCGAGPPCSSEDLQAVYSYYSVLHTGSKTSLRYIQEISLNLPWKRTISKLRLQIKQESLYPENNLQKEFLKTRFI